MKTKAVFFALFSFISVICLSQNRISQWDSEKINSVRVEIRNNDQQIDVITLNDKSDIETLLAFLGKTEFRNCDSGIPNKKDIVDQWLVKMIFKGQHDQVLIMKDYATIGKTLFMVDSNVFEEVKKIVYDLKDK